MLYAEYDQNIVEFSSNDKFLATTASTCCYRMSPFFSFFSFGYVILYQTSLTQSHLITSKMTVHSSYRLYSLLSYFFCNIKLQSISTEIQAEHPSFFSFYTDQQLDPSSFLFFFFSTDIRYRKILSSPTKNKRCSMLDTRYYWFVTIWIMIWTFS